MKLACDDYRTGKLKNEISEKSLATESGKATLAQNATIKAQMEQLAKATAEAKAATAALLAA